MQTIQQRILQQSKLQIPVCGEGLPQGASSLQTRQSPHLKQSRLLVWRRRRTVSLSQTLRERPLPSLVQCLRSLRLKPALRNNSRPQPLFRKASPAVRQLCSIQSRNQMAHTRWLKKTAPLTQTSRQTLRLSPSPRRWQPTFQAHQLRSTRGSRSKKGQRSPGQTAPQSQTFSGRLCGASCTGHQSRRSLGPRPFSAFRLRRRLGL